MTSQLTHPIYQNLQETLGSLKTSFDDFKTTYHQRLQQLEAEKKSPSKFFDGSSTPPALPAPDSTRLESKTFQAFLRGHSSLATKSLTAGEDPGSFTLPTYLQTRLQSELEAAGSFRSLARSMSISSSFVDLIVDIDLPDAEWVEEGAERKETNTPNFIRTRIMTHELYAKPSATQKLLEDAHIDVESWLIEKVARTMRRMETQSFLTGAGDHEPKGILAYPTQLAVKRDWGTFQEVQTGLDGGFVDNRSDSLLEILHTLPTQYLEEAVWLMAPSTLARIRFLHNIEGRSLYEHVHDAPFRMKLFGYPVILLDGMPTLHPDAPSKSVIFGNFKEAYQIVDRQNFQILRDPYSHKPYVEFYIHKRVGGDVINFDALKILNFSKHTEAVEG